MPRKLSPRVRQKLPDVSPVPQPPPAKSANYSGLVLVLLLLVAMFFVGSLWTKVQYLEKQASARPTPTGNGQPSAGQQPQQVAVSVDPLREDDHVRGNRNARILLIEYSDLECPFCKKFHPTAKQIVDAYKDQVAWVYRHFPLDQLHSKADKEAEAVECAGELGGNEVFWKLTDKIFEVTPANNGLNLEDLPSLASQVGLDSVKFKTCLDSGKYAAHVESDFQSGVRAGVSGTPGNILLDTKTGKTQPMIGAYPFEQFKSAIDGMLSES